MATHTHDARNAGHCQACRDANRDLSIPTYTHTDDDTPCHHGLTYAGFCKAGRVTHREGDTPYVGKLTAWVDMTKDVWDR